jgi:hypothetical protein
MLRGQTCLAWGPNKSGQSLWNLAAKPDKAERSDMSGQSLWNPTKGSDMSGLIGVFGGRIDF